MKHGPMTARVLLRELRAINTIPRMKPEIRMTTMKELHRTIELGGHGFVSARPSPKT